MSSMHQKMSLLEQNFLNIIKKKDQVIEQLYQNQSRMLKKVDNNEADIRRIMCMLLRQKEQTSTTIDESQCTFYIKLFNLTHSKDFLKQILEYRYPNEDNAKPAYNRDFSPLKQCKSRG